MQRTILLSCLCFAVFLACNNKDTGINIGQDGSGMVDKLADERTIAGESLPEESFRGGIEEKIIRNAYMAIQTGNVMKSYDKTLDLVKKYDAIILNSDISRYDGSEHAQVLVKIKPQYFTILLDELSDVGRIDTKSITEEDVTEEYYDVEARLANARKVQDRLYGILNRANKVEDILKVEKEIERVGEKIEMLEGRIKYFDSMVDYSRVSITLYSTKKPFIDLGSIGRGFGNAVKYAVHVFFLIVWFIIIIIPIAAMVFILRPVVVFIVRRFKKKQ